MTVVPTDERPREGVVFDEWVFAAWSDDATIGFVSGHRLTGGRAWYWFALVEAGRPLLHLTEWDVKLRADPFIVKAPEMWAEHHCVEPLTQWTIGNEGHAVALDDPAEAFGRAYGTPTPMATDVEWYSAGPPQPLVSQPGGTAPGFEQAGIAHGVVELLDRPNLDFDGWPAHRWRRWGDRPGPVPLPRVVAHTDLRAGFAFPDGTVSDWVLTRSGWRCRTPPV